MKKQIKAIFYKCPPLRRSAVRVRDFLQAGSYLRSYARPCRTDEKRILFCAYSGRQYACSPRAIYEMLRADESNGYRFVWAFQRPEQFPELAEDRRTKLVSYGSEEFKKELASCRYWVFNTRVPSGIVKKEDQVYIQTWHGTPLKKLGYDLKQYISGADDKKSLQYSYRTDAQRYDFLLSPSPYYSEKMASAFHLKALHKENCILELGYPRNDSLYMASEEKIQEIRRSLGLLPGEKTILYAPTWRETALDPAKGSSYSKGIDFQLGLDLKKLLKELGEDYKILLRTHYIIRNNIDFSAYGERLIDVSDYKDINALYLAADLLLTDYSSVFFDYAVLKKPMLFYMYDLHSYQGIRDFYIDLRELPGKILTQEEELPSAIRQSLEEKPDEEVWRIFNQKFNPYPGPVSKKVWDAIVSKKG